jgi:prepilin-type N-terminal cleavage/methylation domain-containing protein
MRYPAPHTEGATVRRAFTLIEILAVVAIIAVLAALLFPVFTKARERAKCTQCISNLHQIGTGLTLYIDDFDGTYPWAYDADWVARYGKRPALRQTMSAYVQSQAIWQCPSDMGDVIDPLDPWYTDSTPFRADTKCLASYGYLGVGAPDEYGRLAGYQASRVKKPTTAVLCFELRPWHDRFRVGRNWDRSPALQNVLHCDGHVDRRTHAQLDYDQVDGVS